MRKEIKGVNFRVFFSAKFGTQLFARCAASAVKKIRNETIKLHLVVQNEMIIVVML